MTWLGRVVGRELFWSGKWQLWWYGWLCGVAVFIVGDMGGGSLLGNANGGVAEDLSGMHSGSVCVWGGGG